MKIRNAEKQDAAKLAAVGVCVWIDTYATEGVRENLARYALLEFTETKLLALIDAQPVFLLEEGEHTLGYAVVAVREDGVEIDTFYLLPQFQRCGYGRKLIEYLQQHYTSLWLSCWAENTNALAFYTANGFTKTGETVFTLDGESHKNIVLSYG